MGPHGMGFPNHGKDDQGYKMYITAVVMIILSGLFVIARCATRVWMLGRLGWDDFTIVMALVSDLDCSSFGITSSSVPTGYP
jgi:hypothetical protein